MIRREGVHASVWRDRHGTHWHFRMTLNGRAGLAGRRFDSWAEAMQALDEAFRSLAEECGDDGATATRRHWQKSVGNSQGIRRCEAITLKGTRCTNDGVRRDDAFLCWMHRRTRR